VSKGQHVIFQGHKDIFFLEPLQRTGTLLVSSRDRECLVLFVICLLKKLVCRRPILQHLVNRCQLQAAFFGSCAGAQNLQTGAQKLKIGALFLVTC
jgi:hypothetical protein